MPSTLYTDPRLVALYDTLNPFAADTDFYLALAAGMQRVIDLGCGTGLLACELASRGHGVIAIDPAPEMLRVARHRPNGDRVQWIEGDARALALLPPADLLVMTGHVAQVFLDDTVFLDTLKAARYALRNGGALAFESRNPAARAWESWTHALSRRVIDVNGIGEVEVWQDDVSASPESGIRFNTYYRFEAADKAADRATDNTLTSTSELRFRTQDELTALLEAAGFRQLAWQGDWDGAAVSAASRELIVVAR